MIVENSNMMNAEIEVGSKVRYKRYMIGSDCVIQSIGEVTRVGDSGMITVLEKTGEKFMVPKEWVIEEVMELAPTMTDLEKFTEEYL